MRVNKHPCNWKKWYVVTEDGLQFAAFSNWNAAAKERDELAAHAPDKQYRVMTTVFMPPFLEELRQFTVAELNAGQTHEKAS